MNHLPTIPTPGVPIGLDDVIAVETEIAQEITTVTDVDALEEMRAKADALARYDDMCRAIAECHRVDEAKDYRDKAEALRAYAKQANNRDAEVKFAEIKVRAEIKCGELLKDMAERGERDQGKGGDRKSQSHDATVKLESLGITKDESSRFQQTASAPRKKVEAAFREARETQTPVSSAQIRALTKQPDFTPAQRADHERLWRVLRALEQIADQDVTPKEWLESLPDYMVARVTNHLQKARPWLERLFKLWENRNAN